MIIETSGQIDTAQVKKFILENGFSNLTRLGEGNEGYCYRLCSYVVKQFKNRNEELFELLKMMKLKCDKISKRMNYAPVQDVFLTKDKNICTVQPYIDGVNLKVNNIQMAHEKVKKLLAIGEIGLTSFFSQFVEFNQTTGLSTDDSYENFIMTDKSIFMIDYRNKSQHEDWKSFKTNSCLEKATDVLLFNTYWEITESLKGEKSIAKELKLPELYNMLTGHVTTALNNVGASPNVIRNTVRRF